MNEGIIRAIKKTVNAVKKVDNPRISISAPQSVKPVMKKISKFKQFLKSKAI